MRVTWFEPGTLEAPAAVRSGTPSARERQRTPCGDAQDAQARGADAPSARAREVVEEAGERRAASRLSCLSSRPAAGIRRSRGGTALATPILHRSRSTHAIAAAWERRSAVVKKPGPLRRFADDLPHQDCALARAFSSVQSDDQGDMRFVASRLKFEEHWPAAG